MRKCANISPYMRRQINHIRLCQLLHLNLLIYEENLIFFFISVEYISTFSDIDCKTAIRICLSGNKVFYVGKRKWFINLRRKKQKKEVQYHQTFYDILLKTSKVPLCISNIIIITIFTSPKKSRLKRKKFVTMPQESTGTFFICRSKPKGQLYNKIGRTSKKSYIQDKMSNLKTELIPKSLNMYVYGTLYISNHPSLSVSTWLAS